GAASRSAAGSVSRLVPALELVPQVVQEAARERAVDEAMVVREGQVHDRADRDYVLAHVVLDDPRALDDGVGAEHRRLRLAAHRRPVERAIADGIRARVGATLNLILEQLIVADALRAFGYGILQH